MKTIEELGDKLCDLCPLDECRRGTHGTPNGPVSCEGSHCDEAYDAYKESDEANE